MKDVIEFANQKLGNRGILLYLTEFGSHLYGTNGPNSDKDYKGLFLPNKNDLLIGEPINAITYTTGSSFSKNTKNDVDIQLYSLQHWFKLVHKCDTQALDLLYSMYASHVNQYVYNIDIIKSYNPTDFFNIAENTAYYGYVFAQAKKYGLRGSRSGLLKSMIEWIDNQEFTEDEMNNKFGDYYDLLIKLFNHKSYCFIKNIVNNGTTEQMLFILGKGFGRSIKLKEAIKRIKTEYDKYGARAKLAEENKGVDWKAVSHAFRCMKQVREIAQTGYVHYPLNNAEFLKDVKFSKYTWNDIEPMLIDDLHKTESIIKEVPKNENVINNYKECILKYYNWLLG